MQDGKKYEDDDGRVIVSMDVDGMPWRGKRNAPAAPERREPDAAPLPAYRQPDTLTDDQTRHAIWGALLAALSVVGVFSVTLVLFVLFCIYVWFK